MLIVVGRALSRLQRHGHGHDHNHDSDNDYTIKVQHSACSQKMG